MDRRRTALLLPHLARAVRLGWRLSKAALAETAALEALDRLDTGVLVLDRTGRIVHANAEAEAALRESPEFGVVSGRFHLREAPLQDRFAQLFREGLAMARGQAPGGAAAALAIPRASALPLSLSVAPLRPNWAHRLDQEPMVLVFIKDPERPRLHLERLRHMFGFTPTEALIAAELARGQDLSEIATTHRIGVGTVRWHLKAILIKTASTRQAEAAVLLARSVAALPEPRPPHSGGA